MSGPPPRTTASPSSSCAAPATSLCARSLAGIGAQRPDGIVLVREAGRSLTAGDVADIAGVAVIAQVEVNSTVARKIDAGLLISRLNRLDELAPLGHWTARQLASRCRVPTPPCAPETAPLT